jgi:hypothetical protein
MSNKNPDEINTNQDFQYLNVIINNNTESAIPAEYNETRLQPILNEMADYTMSIVRFKVPTTSIPLLIFEDNTYEIGFSFWDGVSANRNQNVVSTYVRFEDIGYSPDLRVQPPYNRFVYYYSQMLNAINAAVLRLWNHIAPVGVSPAPYNGVPALNDNDGGGNYTIHSPKYAPYFSLEKNSDYINVILPSLANTNPSNPFTDQVGPRVNILMNPKLYYFFSGFSTEYLATPPLNNYLGLAPAPAIGDSRLIRRLEIDSRYTNIANRRQWDGLPAPLIDQDATNPDPDIIYNYVQADYPSINKWQQLNTIIITTTIALTKEYVVRRGDDGTTSQLEVLTDFLIPGAGRQLQDNVFYYPQGENRRTNFNGTGTLDRFDLRVFFQTDDQEVFPLLIPVGEEFSCKILFERRKARTELQYSKSDTQRYYKH